MSDKYKFWGSVLTTVLGVGLLVFDIAWHHSVTLEAVSAGMIAAGIAGFGLQMPVLGPPQR